MQKIILTLLSVLFFSIGYSQNKNIISEILKQEDALQKAIVANDTTILLLFPKEIMFLKVNFYEI
jgi:hypothetical protein